VGPKSERVAFGWNPSRYRQRSEAIQGIKGGRGDPGSLRPLRCARGPRDGDCLRRRLVLGLLALPIVTALVSPALAGETIRVAINQLKFDPQEISAHVGDTIEWSNSDFVVHTATARNKNWDVTIPAKGVGRVTLERAGDVDYYCRFHPNMTGRISVAP
jgi:plastocyanin